MTKKPEKDKPDTTVQVQVQKEVALQSIVSPHSETLHSQSHELSCKLEAIPTSQMKSKNDTFYSDVQSSTVKQEENQTPEQIILKLRKKVCRKIFQILTKELNLGNLDSQELVIQFETALHSAYPAGDLQYLQAVKAVCNRVRVTSFLTSD